MIEAIRFSNLWEANLYPPQEEKLKNKIVERLKNSLGKNYINYYGKSRIDGNDIYIINYKLYERRIKMEKIMNNKIEDTLDDILKDYENYFTIIEEKKDII